MASQVAQSLFTRAPLTTTTTAARRVSAGYGRASVATLAVPICSLAMEFVAPLRVTGSSSSSLMGGSSLWQSLGSSGSRGSRALGTQCSVYVGSYGVTPETVRWVVAAAVTVLLLKRDAGAKKQFWAGILALEAPRDVLYWAKSEYGLWVASIGLALKIFYHVPAELDYPLAVYLFLVCLPGQAVALRHTVGAKVLSAALALFVAYQYFYNTVRLSDAFKGEHLVNTILIVVTALACVWFFALTVL